MRSMGKAKLGIVMILAAILVCVMSSVSAFALTVPDTGKSGSISVTMTDPTTKKAAPGGNLF